MPSATRQMLAGRRIWLTLLFLCALGPGLGAAEGDGAAAGVRVLGPGQADGTFVVEALGSVSCGRRPVPRVLLKLERVGGQLTSSTRTDGSGLYAFRFDAEPGVYRVFALAPPAETAPYPGFSQAAFRVAPAGAIGGKPQTALRVLMPIGAVSPSDGEPVSPRGVVLSWAPMAEATHYLVTLVPMPAGDRIATPPQPRTYRVAKPRLTLEEGLRPGWRYAWEVEARGAGGPIGLGLSQFQVTTGGGPDERAPTGVQELERPAGPTVRIATYNVNWGCPDVESTLEALAATEADIICVQETNPTWERLIRRRLAAAYPTMFFHDHELPAGGAAILSRWPLRELEVVPSQTGWFDALRFLADSPAGPLQVLTVHLQPVTFSNEGFSLQAWLASAAARRMEVERFAGSLADGMPTVVAGDLNEGDTGPAVAWLKEQGFANALPAFQPGAPTWCWPVGSITLRLQIDHILYSGGLICRDARVLEVGGSDHFPVFADLSRN